MIGGYYTAIETVKDYGEYLEDLFYSLPMEYTLEQMSYSRWAIATLLERLECCLPGDEIKTMENLSNEIDEYYRLNTENGYMFLLASEIVSNVIDLLY